MTTQATKLPSGAMIEIQSSAATAGIDEASGITDKAKETWIEGVNLVAEMAAVVVERLKQPTAAAKEVTVEFGVSFGGKTGIILVEGTAEANLKVSIKW